MLDIVTVDSGGRSVGNSVIGGMDVSDPGKDFGSCSVGFVGVAITGKRNMGYLWVSGRCFIRVLFPIAQSSSFEREIRKDHGMEGWGKGKRKAKQR